jgi:hypothetical protein
VRHYVFGNDVFKSVQWLSSLRSGRSNPYDGYLFALTPYEAQRLVPEFPRVFNLRPRTTTTRTTTQRTTFGPFPCKQVDPNAPKFKVCNRGNGSVWNGYAPVQVPKFENTDDLLNDDDLFKAGGLLEVGHLHKYKYGHKYGYKHGYGYGHKYGYGHGYEHKHGHSSGGHSGKYVKHGKHGYWSHENYGEKKHYY